MSFNHVFIASHGMLNSKTADRVSRNNHSIRVVMSASIQPVCWTSGSSKMEALTKPNGYRDSGMGGSRLVSEFSRYLSG